MSSYGVVTQKFYYNYPLDLKGIQERMEMNRQIAITFVKVATFIQLIILKMSLDCTLNYEI